ncbi:MAG TPA: hypothetical protein VGC38_06855 [Pseudolabrys sp.]
MASDDKKTKATPVPKVESKPEPAAAKAEPAPAPEKAADASQSYSRGEGQKPVSQAYKDNWNAIFGKKATSKKIKKPAKKTKKKR